VKIAIEIIGWTAAAMMLSAYLLLTSGRLSSSSGTYQWLNVLIGRSLEVLDYSRLDAGVTNQRERVARSAAGRIVIDRD
jgi:hypothetical protein